MNATVPLSPAAPTGAAPARSAPPVPTAPPAPMAATANPAGPASPILAAEGLTVRYGPRTALDGVSFDLRPGTVLALLGRNGAGKSSLVRCLLGQQRPSAGRALLFGADVWRRRASLMAAVGVVPDQPNAPSSATAQALARLCRPLYERWDDTGFAARLRRFGVPDDLPFGRLSRGQQRQVELALALAPSPPLLILDEPTLGLDAVARQAFFAELIGELADRGTTVLLATHDLAAVERIAERVAFLDRGHLLLEEDLEALKQRCQRLWLPASPLPTAATAGDALGTLGTLGGMTVLRRSVRDWGAEAVVGDYEEERFQRYRTTPEGSHAESMPLSLEEIFLALVGEP